jgi:hypothetical protein
MECCNLQCVLHNEWIKLAEDKLFVMILLNVAQFTVYYYYYFFLLLIIL